MNTNADTSQYLSVLNGALGQQQTAKLDAASRQDSLDKVSQEFSAVMITQLLNIMFESVDVDPNFGGGHGEETWRSVLLDEYGKNIGAAGGFGIADMVKAQLLKYQEVGV